MEIKEIRECNINKSNLLKELIFLLSKTEEILIDILNDIADKMTTASEDMEEVRTKIDKLKSWYWYGNTGWGKPKE